MTTQLLIYERAVPVTQQRHGDWSIKTGTDYTFARHVNSVPLMATEFQSAAAEYAIVFAGTEEAVMPAVILGFRDRQNLFLTDTGGWQPKYVPAFVRRYPFVFSSSDDGARFTLCIDEEFAGCNQEGRGERLFDSQGERTQYLESMLGFLQAFQVQFQRTQAFCGKLKQLDLLEPMHAQFTPSTGQPIALTGFMAVNRDRLKGLSGERLAELARTDELELVYTHLQSMRNFSPMAERAAKADAAAGEAAPTAEEKKPAARKRTSKKAKD
jgi:hypothetical protein